VAQLSIALTILVATVLAIYAVERVWFGQEPDRAVAIMVWVGGADIVLGFVLLVLLPLTCVYLVQATIFGRQRAENMRPFILRRAFLAFGRRGSNK